MNTGWTSKSLGGRDFLAERLVVDHWGLDRLPFGGSSGFIPLAGHVEAVERARYVARRGPRSGWLTGPAGVGKSRVLAAVADRLERQGRAVVLLDAAGWDTAELLAGLVEAVVGIPAVAEREASRLLRDVLRSRTLTDRPLTVLFDHVWPGNEAVDLLARLAGSGAGSAPVSVLAAGAGSGGVGADFGGEMRIDVPPLDWWGTARFVASALVGAGARREVFEEDAVTALHEHARGIPRSLERLAELAMVAGAGEGAGSVDERIVHAVACEVAGGGDGETNPRPTPVPFRLAPRGSRAVV